MKQSVFSFHKKNDTHVIVTFGVDSKNGHIVVDVYARLGAHESEKRITLTSGNRLANPQSMQAEIEKAKDQVALAVENRQKALSTLEALSMEP